MTVDSESGRLVVGAMSYALLVLPDHEDTSLDVLRRVGELVEGGASVLGSVRPTRTRSLTDYPRADGEVDRISAEMWGVGPSEEPAGPRNHPFGAGQVLSGMTPREALSRLEVVPDFEVLAGGSQEGPDRIDYIHRRTDDADVYFVCNSAQELREVSCRFRDAAGRAELWDPVTGEIRAARGVERAADGSATLELQLSAFGSTFVVFRRGGAAPSEPPELPDGSASTPIPIEGTWTVTFQSGRRAPESVAWDELIDWTTSPDPGIRYFSGTATYGIAFELPEAAAGDCWLDLGRVREVAEVRLDGRDLGIAWTFPFRVRVPAELLGAGRHALEVEVTNVWNNRIVGDQLLPASERVTRTNLQGRHTPESPLVPSGLLGPVTLQPLTRD
jgi:hypothetical protein